MANYCDNNVTFLADAERLAALRQLFLQMQEQFIRTDEGQLPLFIKSDEGYFFGIDVSENVVSYLTKWVPNTAHLIAIADHFGVDFTHQYAETGNGIFGETIYDNQQVTTTALSFEDFDQYDYDEGLECYVFEGCRYDDNIEILEILLERKKQARQFLN